MNIKIRKELGVNFSNSFKDERQKTELQIAIENSFNQDDVSIVCLDTRKWRRMQIIMTIEVSVGISFEL